MPVKLISVLLLLSSFSLTAREYTQPPSIALRNALAYIVEARLTSKSSESDQSWTLSFDKIKDLHNSFDAELAFSVNTQLAQSLHLEQIYVVAFQSHRKTKIEGMVNYIPFEKGPTLISVQGADPAIFNPNERLINQLKTDPKLATTDPQLLLNRIMQGIASDDPKIKEFFIRELINWNGLPASLTPSQLKVLADAVEDPELSVGALTAFFENRPEFHQSLGTKVLLKRASELLYNLPVGLDDGAKIPTLIHTALNLLQVHQAGDFQLFKRWLGSNNPSISELALLQMHRLNPTATLNAVKKKLKHTLINETSRRVLVRYLKKHESKA